MVGQTAPRTERMYVGPSRRARRSQYTRTAAVAGGALGLLIALLIVAKGGGGGSLPTRPVTAKILSTTVQARVRAGAALAPLHDGDTVRENAVIETDAAGLGEFKYADGSVFRVGPSSEYSLTRARTNGKRRQITSRLVTGKSWHHVVPRSGSNKYAVTVLGASGEVKGTSFATECEVENDCIYTVVSGHVHMTDAVDHTADLDALDQVEVKFGRLEPVKHLDESELPPWAVDNIRLDGGTAPPTTEPETTTSLEETTTTVEGQTTTTVFGVTITTSRTGTTRASGPQPTTGTTSPPTATTKPPTATTATTRPPTTATTAPSTTQTTCKRNQYTGSTRCG